LLIFPFLNLTPPPPQLMYEAIQTNQPEVIAVLGLTANL